MDGARRGGLAAVHAPPSGRSPRAGEELRPHLIGSISLLSFRAAPTSWLGTEHRDATSVDLSCRRWDKEKARRLQGLPRASTCLRAAMATAGLWHSATPVHGWSRWERLAGVKQKHQVTSARTERQQRPGGARRPRFDLVGGEEITAGP
jgi:hypothetical protein